MANVFICHRGSDLDEAERLAKALQKRRHRAWLDKWNIKIGDSIIARMNEGLGGSTYLIMCLSASGNLAPWMSREWMSFLARQLEAQDVKVLPVRLTGGDLPAILSDIKYANLEVDWDTGLSELLDAMK